MKKSLLILVLLCLISCNNKKKTGIPLEENQELKIEQKTNVKQGVRDVKNTKYGIKYSVPKNWVKLDKEIESVDLKGNATAFQTNYTDSINNSTVKIKYHVGEKGLKLYNYKKSKVDDSNVKLTNVANHEAVISTEILERTGKGKILDVKVKRINVSFINKKNELIEFKFDVNVDSEEDKITKRFLNMISSLETIN